MSAKRSMSTYAAGAASAVAVLVASPATYELLRRWAGLAGDRHHYEDPAPDAFAEPDPAAAADVRLSLRARLAEDAAAGATAAVSGSNRDASASAATDAAPARAAIDAARARVRDKARAATERLASDEDTADFDPPDARS